MDKVKFEAKFTDIEKVNPLFSKCKVRTMYVGDNRNMSSISKDAVISAIPTLFNCPIIGEFSETIEDFKGHGGKLEVSSDGVKYIQTTRPYGVIPESSKISWELVAEEDGIVREYLVAEGYIWTGRYPEAFSIIEQGKGQSMEIEDCMGDYRDDGVFNIEQFVFSALCVLGDGVEPCFESANITGYSLDKDKFKFEFNQMITELKESLRESGENVEDVKEEVFEEVVEAVEEVVEEVVETEEVVEEVAEVVEEVVEAVEEIAEEFEAVEEVEVVEEVVEVAEEVVEEPSNEDKIFDLNKKLRELTGMYADMVVEMAELKSYKINAELAKEKEAKEALVAEYAIGLSEDEMKPVVDKADEYSLAEMKTQLNEIFTAKNLNSLKKKFSVKDGAEDDIIIGMPMKDKAKNRYAV